MKTTALLFSAILIVFLVNAQTESRLIANYGHELGIDNGGEQVLKQNVIRVKKAEFKAFMADHDNYFLMDIRTPREFNNGTIEGAVNINYSNPNFEAELNKLDKTQPILMFCQSGGRSGRALSIFKSLGFEHVLELQGGYANY